jgi:DNA-binding MarR family transcriptional regulator
MSTSKFSEEPPTAGYVLETLFKTTHHIHLHFEMYLSSRDIPSYLTGPRMRFLKVVSDAGKIRMKDLASKLGIKARTVTQFVDALEKENMLIRVPDPDDRRVIWVQIPDTAIPLIKKTGDAMVEAAEKTLAHLPEEERNQLLDTLYRLADIRDNNEDMETC